MKLRFWISLIAFLFPTSAFANSCASFLKNKNYEKTWKNDVLRVATGTHKPTKETKWILCSFSSPHLDQKKHITVLRTCLNCEGKKFYTQNLEYTGIYDRLNRAVKLNFKGKWMKRFCTQKKIGIQILKKNFLNFILKKQVGSSFLVWKRA